MSMSAAVERLLFRDKDGGGGGAHAGIIKHRFLSFLIWQFLQSTFLMVLSKTLLFAPFTENPFTPNFASLVAFGAFQLSLVVVSVSLFFLSSPYPLPYASPFEISLSFLRLIFVSGSDQSLLKRKVRVSLSFLFFISLCGVVGAVSVASLCWGCDCFRDADAALLGRRLGFRGFFLGFLYGLNYVYKQRWVLRFPIVQRPPFFGFKMGFPSSAGQAFKFSVSGYILSGILVFALPINFKSQSSLGKFVVEQIIFFFGSFVVILCWELSHYLHQVLHTKRFVFAPPKGSAAAATNPTEPLLATLEESSPKSLLQYLAYLDLRMVCENNVDTWRRAAFFEETGETYRRVIAACLHPLEQFTQELAEGLEISSAEKQIPLSDQLSSPSEGVAILKLRESFSGSELYAWCIRIVASLTARSRKEDRFGVAQISGSNSAVISVLLSCLLAVEVVMGKKTSIQSTQVMGPGGIKWATMNTVRRESTAGAMLKIRGSSLYAKAYTLADILKTSIYCIVYAFHDEILISAKSSNLEKDWIFSGKPLYGSRELLVHKLGLFLDSEVS